MAATPPSSRPTRPPYPPFKPPWTPQPGTSLPASFTAQRCPRLIKKRRRDGNEELRRSCNLRRRRRDPSEHRPPAPSARHAARPLDPSLPPPRRGFFGRPKAIVAPLALSRSGVGGRHARDRIRHDLHGRRLLRPNLLLHRAFLPGLFGDYLGSALGSSRAYANTSLRSGAAPAIWASRKYRSTAHTMCSFKYPQGNICYRFCFPQDFGVYLTFFFLEPEHVGKGCYFRIASLDSEYPNNQGISGWASSFLMKTYMLLCRSCLFHSIPFVLFVFIYMISPVHSRSYLFIYMISPVGFGHERSDSGKVG